MYLSVYISVYKFDTIFFNVDMFILNKLMLFIPLYLGNFCIYIVFYMYLCVSSYSLYMFVRGGNVCLRFQSLFSLYFCVVVSRLTYDGCKKIILTKISQDIFIEYPRPMKKNGCIYVCSFNVIFFSLTNKRVELCSKPLLYLTLFIGMQSFP